jgi:hypothetical protein
LTKSPIPALSQIKTNRDVLLFQLAHDEILVIGCDSAGGIGPNPLDKIKVNGFILGKFTARTALMEVLAVNAMPVCIVDALGVAPEPTGADILRGIRAEAEKAGLDPKLAVTGSTEKNIIVEQTGIGVTVIGTCRKGQLKIGTSLPGDVVAAVGIPSVGNEVLPAEKAGNIADSTDILKLRELPYVHEVIPVGSTGIAHELKTLAESSKLNYTIAKQQKVDVYKSAGPATVALASLPENNVANLMRQVNKPVNVIGHLH